MFNNYNNGEPIEGVRNHCYHVEGKITEGGRNKLDIIGRIAQGKRAFETKITNRTGGGGFNTSKNIFQNIRFKCDIRTSVKHGQ